MFFFLLFFFFFFLLFLVAQSCPTLCDPADIARQAPPSMGFSRREYWSGVPLLYLKRKRKPGKQEHYLFNFMPSELALPPDGISICSHKSQYFPVSPCTIDFYVGHINSM